MTESTTRQPHERIAFSGFSVDDIQKAKKFHGRILGLEAKPDV